MVKTKTSEIAKIIGGKIIAGEGKRDVTNVVIDSREASKGSLFVALKGEFTDGHRFLQSACEGGASCLLISDQEAASEYGQEVMKGDSCDVILVDDALMALQDFSSHYLMEMDMECIAVTGSVGKTTTRDMLYAAMKTKYNTGTNQKNYNSETGLPLTLLSFTPDMEKGVLEMGMDAPGQIARLVEIAEPRAAVITNIGISHIERLGSRKEIFKAKMEIASDFDGKNTLVVNGDDDMLGMLSKELVPYELIKVGTKASCDYTVKNIRDRGIEGISFDLILPGEGKERETIKVNLPVPGAHNALNAGLAIAGAAVMGVEPRDAISGIMNMEMTGSRMKVMEAAGIKVVDDAYNAAPASMNSALDMLMHTKGKRRIAVLGGINELGPVSEEEHRGVGAHVAKLQPDLLITIGDMASWIQDGAKKESKKTGKNKTEYIHVSTKEELYPRIDKIFKNGDVVLVKASRSYELEELANKIVKEKSES